MRKLSKKSQYDIEDIKEEMAKLKKSVHLKVFSSQKIESDGTKICLSEDCIEFLDWLRIYEENSKGLLTIEELSIDDNPELAKNYDINRVPTISFIDNSEQEIIQYLAPPKGIEIRKFIQTIISFGGGSNEYEAIIKQNLDKIPTSTIRTMIDQICPFCPDAIVLSNLFAIASEGKIRSIIIDVMENRDLWQHYDSNRLPAIYINDQEPFVGSVDTEEILKGLIKGNSLV